LSKPILDDAQIRRAIVRVAHEIVERNGGAGTLALLGIHTRGVPLAERLAKEIAAIEGQGPAVGTVDVGLYRDDAGRQGPGPHLRPTEVSFDIDDLIVVLVDDVLYTGRTVRAALDALTDLGRPCSVQLAVLVDRGHRELPIRADYVGKNVPTSRGQQVTVKLAEVDGVEGVFLEEAADAAR